jgi:hypothetical protein
MRLSYSLARKITCGIHGQAMQYPSFSSSTVLLLVTRILIGSTLPECALPFFLSVIYVADRVDT